MRRGLRLGRNALRRGAAAAALLAASALSAAAPLTWVRAETQDKSFSIETPCSAELLETLSVSPEKLGALTAPRDARVLCKLDDDTAVFTAIMQHYPVKPGEPTMFAIIEERVAKRGKAQSMTRTMIDGRKALINREAEDGVLAQTVIVDMGTAGLVLLNVGIMENSPLSADDKAQVIDHFTNSLKVNAK